MQDLSNQEMEQLKAADTIALADKCKLLFSSDQFAEAENILNYFIDTERNKSDPMPFRLRAECRLKLGKYIQALHDMENAMLLDPSMECSKSSQEHYQIKKGLMRMSNDI